MFTDAVNFPTRSKNTREVVIRPCELEGDRPLSACSCLAMRRARLEGLDFQIRSRRLDLHAAKQIGDASFSSGRHGLEVVEPRFEIGDLAAEFRQFPRRALPLAISPVQRGHELLNWRAEIDNGAHRQLDG